MRAAERGEDKFARIRLARRHSHAGATLIDINDRTEIREIQFRVNAVLIKIQRNRHDIQISRALAVAEQSSVAATPVQRSLCVCKLTMSESRFLMLRHIHSI